MLDCIKKESNIALTENGAAAFASTGSDCLDLFSSIGALGSQSEEEIIGRFIKAYAENATLAMRILFFARDIRGGLGSRRVFRVILSWLAENESASVRRNVNVVAEYGRWDDLLTLIGTPCERDAFKCIAKQLAADLESLNNDAPVSLLGKWLPSVNASNPTTVHNARRIARALGMNDATYRKTLVRLRARIHIIENYLRKSDYTFDYSKQPSKAMFKYRMAFLRNDAKRYLEFSDSVARGEVTLHTGTLTPYDIIQPFFDRQIDEAERVVIDTTWKAQEDFTDGENALVVADGSGSMYSGSRPLPAAVALSLAIYYAERNTGEFHNHFITFSEKPQLIEIKGRDILEKVLYCHEFNECGNTDIQKVFELILNAAVKNNLPQSELPTTLFIISDMEFDFCAEDAEMTNFEYSEKAFAAHGYSLPRVVFWNVNSKNPHQPVTMNEQGVTLVSGASAHIFSMLRDRSLTPYGFMLHVLESERYAAISA